MYNNLTMKLFNLTQKKLITDNLVIADNFFLRNHGLIGVSKENAYALYFQTHFGIHTFGMKFSLTILVCDQNFIAKKIEENLKPNSFFFWNLKYSNIIELPFLSYQVKIGDRLEIK